MGSSPPDQPAPVRHCPCKASGSIDRDLGHALHHNMTMQKEVVSAAAQEASFCLHRCLACNHNLLLQPVFNTAGLHQFGNKMPCAIMM